ncbi:hypothetical protein [Roseiconus lacunae]|uniref:hypothetical protein n=1 Tax=Roseiconus lacunae TaxID=2605694 RepID=UPI001E60A985|nr:hypothetical protein [Roseiconus lacunae]MCD0460068.1 hypothetical protein [Roseiconus lacunae]
MTSDLNQVLPDGVYGHVAFHNGISIQEIAGREGSDSRGADSASRVFLLKGNSDPLACRNALYDGPVAINVYDGLVLNSMDRERMGPQEWQFTCSYDSVTPDIGDYTISIDTTGGQIMQTYAYAQTSFPAPGQTATNFGNAIDVQDGKPQGVQRVIPALKINVKAKIATEYLGASTIAYAKAVAKLTGFVNSTSMFGGEFAAGELLFIGATGDIVAKNPQLTFSFLASENVTGLTIGDIVGINKKGHEYLWFDFSRSKDAATKRGNSSIRAAYVGQVYGTTDLNSMSIGVSPT